MEHCKISNLFNNSTVLKFVAKQWIEINDFSSGQYSVNRNVRFKTSMLRSDLCDYSEAYIVVKGTISFLAKMQMKMIKLRKTLHLKIMLYLDDACQKLTVHW